MGGIAGIVHWNELASQDTNCIQNMLKSISYRGTEGSSFLKNNQINFGHLRSGTLPESTKEILPYQTPDKRFIITFHGRIDNRKDIYQLSKDLPPLSQIPDSTIALIAFQLFGIKCAENLLGDFAFAIWDNKEKCLYCCRDQMGVKPFYYLKTDSYFAFASEIRALLTLPGTTRELNKERLADFLVCIATERKTTIYKNIFKLQPAHYLLLKQKTLQEVKYWELKPYNLNFKKDQDYYDAFYEIFEEAVSVRLRSIKPIGSYLSGGIDSSSIVSMASGPLKNFLPGPLNTFTHIYDKFNECDERKYFQDVLEKYNITPHYVHGDKLKPEIAFDRTSTEEDEPFCNPHAFAGWHLMHLMQEKGMGVLLDGHDGDSSLSRGDGLIFELATHGHVFRLATELMCFPHATRKKVLESIKNIYLDLFLEKLPFAEPRFSVKRSKLDQLQILSPKLLQQTNVKERVLKLVDQLPGSMQKEKKRHLLNVTQPFHAYALESIERSTGRFGLSCRMPMFDIRLISFCLSLPTEKKLKNGYNRYIVRRSLHEILPPSVRDRKEKTSFGPNLVDAFTVRSKDWLIKSFYEAPPSIYDYIDKPFITKAFERCISSSSIPDLSKLPDVIRTITFLSLSKWMRKTGLK